MATARTDRMAEVMAAEGVDAMLFSSAVSMGYLHGFFESGHERLLVMALDKSGRVRVIGPALSETHARKSGIDDVRPWRDGEDPTPHLAELSRDWGLQSSRIAVDDDMPAGYLLRAQQAMPDAQFQTGQTLLARLMGVKDTAEIDRLRRAGAIVDGAFPRLLPLIRAGMTEREVARILTGLIQDQGGAPTFCIVATGANGAEPHHHTDDTVIEPGDVVILDFGCEVEGYQADITRTIAVGEPDPEAQRVYEIVHAAFTAGHAAVRSGVPCENVDRAARGVIREAGYGDYFVHRTGHGIGMRGHEEPNMTEGNTAPLAVGNCFSVEPGIYLPGRFGVRIENIFACGPDGAVSMNDMPSPTLIQV